MHKRFWTEWQ